MLTPDVDVEKLEFIVERVKKKMQKVAFEKRAHDVQKNISHQWNKCILSRFTCKNISQYEKNMITMSRMPFMFLFT